MNEKHAAVPAAVSTSSRTISARRKRTSRALAAATGEEAEDGEDGFRIAAVQYRVRKITPNHVCVLGAKKLGADIGNAEGSSCSWGIPGGSASVEDDLPEEQGVTSMLLRPAKAAKTEGGGSFAPGVVEGSGTVCLGWCYFVAHSPTITETKNVRQEILRETPLIGRFIVFPGAGFLGHGPLRGAVCAPDPTGEEKVPPPVPPRTGTAAEPLPGVPPPQAKVPATSRRPENHLRDLREARRHGRSSGGAAAAWKNYTHKLVLECRRGTSFSRRNGRS